MFCHICIYSAGENVTLATWRLWPLRESQISRQNLSVTVATTHRRRIYLGWGRCLVHISAISMQYRRMPKSKKSPIVDQKTFVVFPRVTSADEVVRVVRVLVPLEVIDVELSIADGAEEAPADVLTNN